MEALINLANQWQFSLSMSQIIISGGLLALGLIWGRMKIGLLLSLGTVAYWEYTANKSVLFEMATSNTYGIFMTMFAGLFMGFLLVFAWIQPSSR